MSSGPTPTNAPGEPGLISGHAKLAQGMAEKAVGSLAGESWTAAGETAMKDGAAELRAYQEKNPPSASGGSTLGKVEAAAGSAVGCPGVEEAGEKKVENDKQV